MSDTTTGNNRISPPLLRIEIPSEEVALFIRKFAIQALNFAVTTVNSRFQVDISYAYENFSKKWYASIIDGGERGTNVADSLQARTVLENYLSRVSCDEPLTLKGVTPESLRDDNVLKSLALKEKIYYIIANLRKVTTPDTTLRNAVSADQFDNSNLDTNQSDLLSAAKSLSDFVKDGTIRTVDMARFYAVYPAFRERLQRVEMKDLCNSFPHLLELRVKTNGKLGCF